MAPTPKQPKPKDPPSPLLRRDKRPRGDPGYTPVHLPKHAPGDRVPGREVPTTPPSWRGPQDKSGNKVPAKSVPVGEPMGGGILRRPGPKPPHVPSPKPTPGPGGYGAPKYGATPTGGVMAGKSMKPGGGGSFEAFVQKLASQGKSPESARAIAASAGRRKYGSGQMAKWSAAGRKRK